MKVYVIAMFLLCFLIKSYGQTANEYVITSDIANFWNAYDKIRTTNDSALQYAYLNNLFIEKGTPGLKSIMQARRYTAGSYIEAINRYPLFWSSIRANTLKAGKFANEIAAGVDKLKIIYPELKPAKVYFTVGAFLTNGTTLNGMVLIGSELALADKSTVISEFPESLSHLRSFFDSEPSRDIVFLNVHEYVHTQQKASIGNNLLAQCVLEGVAEFVAVTATGNQSPAPAIAYGKQHSGRIREVFLTQMFNPFNGFWLYSNSANEFKIRDLGYYIGYAICEKYYQRSQDKRKAIREMIGLDYNDERELQEFVDHSGFFESKVQTLKRDFEKDRPFVTSITGFKNRDRGVDTAAKSLTIHFSKKMDTRFRNFELGPLGEDNVLGLRKFLGFAEDGRSVTFEIELQPGRQYQLVVGDQFRSEAGVSLRPYLIDIRTTGTSLKPFIRDN